MVKLLFEMVVLTACRSGEVRLSRWSEFDVKQRLWTIPGRPDQDRGGLTGCRWPQGLWQCLGKRRQRVAERASCFRAHGATSRSRTKCSPGSVRRLEINAVPHGFRSSFRDWCSETGVAREVAEACLAHVVKNSVEAAYARSDLLERRREVMREWSDYIASDGDDG